MSNEDNNTLTPYVHEELIKKWAEGHSIQANSKVTDRVWLDVATPSWSTKIRYRLKPKSETVRLKEQVTRLEREVDGLYSIMDLLHKSSFDFCLIADQGSPTLREVRTYLNKMGKAFGGTRWEW